MTIRKRAKQNIQKLFSMDLRDIVNRYFNPRIHEGCDMGRFADNGNSYNISIHASTRDATQAYRLLPKGRTFQSTHPRGMRPGINFVFTVDH